MINITQSENLSYIVWEEAFTDGAQMDSNAIVQVWKGWSGFVPSRTIKSAISKGYKAILSQPWYFDWYERG